MSESQEHLDPKEATEAKLCAYLEGELPASERADIEQHLTANPQHRKLLADLARTRQWMRSIPRQSAPADLAEAFQGQVERSMLLEDSASSPLSKVRWPQLFMVAAIVVLTLGLAGTLIFILKGPPSSRSFSIGPKAAAPPATSPLGAPSADNKLVTPSPVAAVPAPPAAMPVSPAAPITAPPPGSLAAAAGVDRNREILPTRVAGAQAEKDELNADGLKTELESMGYRPSGESRSVCFVIHSNDPAATANQVQGFFTRHQLLGETPLNPAAAPPPAHHATGRVMMAAQQLQDAAVQSPSNGANPAVPTTQAQNQTPQGQGGQAPGVGGANLNSANSGANNSAQGQQQNSLVPNGGAANSNSNALASRSQPVQASPPGDLFYVAHGLTPLQLALLNASLAADNPTQTVRQIMLSQGVQKPLAPVAGAIAKGQLLTVTVAQLVGPGIDKTNVVKVADDGNISLPMIDPLPAAGATAEQLQQRIAAKYREANLIPDATVSVLTSPTTQPTTAPAAPATQPMTEAAKAMPATQPGAAAAATQPAHDQGIDVVVVIEKAK